MEEINCQLMTTGALAEAAQCQPQTVRLYDRLGLLKPAARDTAGRRLYSPDQVPVLREIIAMRIAGGGFGRGRGAT